MKKWSLALVSVLVSAFLVLTGGCATVPNKAVSTAAKYPEKPITFIVPFSAGSGTDVIARALEKTSSRYLGQPLVVVNKPGGAGSIGWNELAASAPDGYTLGITGPDIFLPPLYGETKYNYVTALEPLAQIASYPLVLVISAKYSWNDLDQLMSYAKQHPGEIKFGHWGIGSFGHIAGEMFAKKAGISIEQVPFRGGGEVTAALLGGHIQLAFLNPASVKEHVKSGAVRVLAVAGEKRLTDPDFANIPTFKERGLDVICNYWYGVGVPKELPLAVKAKLADGFKAIINDPEFKANMEKMGQQLEYLGPQESAAVWLADNQRLTQTVQETGILDLIKAQKK